MLLKVEKDYGATGARDKAGTECYALGWPHHTAGSQNIRTMSIIQLLLGNIGVASGGINALRGEPNVQGSTDHAILYNLLPGYLKMPYASMDALQKYTEKYTTKPNDPLSTVRPATMNGPSPASNVPAASMKPRKIQPSCTWKAIRKTPPSFAKSAGDT
jgi:anaerobic selenocysteine-containing dehydrogenase